MQELGLEIQKFHIHIFFAQNKLNSRNYDIFNAHILKFS